MLARSIFASTVAKQALLGHCRGEQSRHAGVAIMKRSFARGYTVAVASHDIGAALDQLGDDLMVPLAGSREQRRLVADGLLLQTGAGLRQHHHHAQVVILGGMVQRGHAVFIVHVEVSALADQISRHFEVTMGGGRDQCRGTVRAPRVDVRPGPNQRPNHIQVSIGAGGKQAGVLVNVLCVWVGPRFQQLSNLNKITLPGMCHQRISDGLISGRRPRVSAGDQTYQPGNNGA